MFSSVENVWCAALVQNWLFVEVGSAETGLSTVCTKISTVIIISLNREKTPSHITTDLTSGALTPIMSTAQ